MSETDPIVGHKTFYDGHHEPIRESEALAILAACDVAKEARAATMPDETAALRAMHEAWTRLTELGWREAKYCPKDGSGFDVIEPGSTGIFRAHYHGEWPTGMYWLEDAGDLWPSHPILFRLDPEKEAERKAKADALREAYLARRKASLP